MGEGTKKKHLCLVRQSSVAVICNKYMYWCYRRFLLFCLMLFIPVISLQQTIIVFNVQRLKLKHPLGTNSYNFK